MQASEKVLDRFVQTIEIFKKGFFYITLPFFLYSFVSFIFFGIVIFLILSTWYFSNFNLGFIDYLNFITPWNIIIWIILLLIFLAYIILYIPFFIFTVKSINDLYNWKDIVDIKFNISFSISRFFSIIKTYWYIFAYVALIPALIFIFWWILFNLWFFLWIWDIFYRLGWVFMWAALFLFVFFAIYRWIKSTFSLYSAIEKDEFTKDNFVKSIELTNGKWWRILWNIFFVGLLVWILSSILSWILSIFFWAGFWFETIFSWVDLTWLFTIPFIVSFIFWWVFNLLIETIWTSFILVFWFLLYKRFELEFLNLDVEKKEEVIEIDDLIEDNKKNEL